MRLERLAAHGFASLRDVDLDLTSVDPGLVAVVGENGAGKTCLLEIVPGAAYRQLPARNGANPVEYATGRESFLDVTFLVDGRGAYRIRLSLDGPKRKADGILEQILATGERRPLSDGKVSTLDEAIRGLFPSFDLFINSAFAAQGRGDEFTRRKPSQRKDLFVEFLALQHYARMAAQAQEHAQLAGEARLRLTAWIEQLQRDTAPPVFTALDHQAQDLQVQVGQAEARQRELAGTIADLEQRLALVQDQVAVYAAAQRQAQALTRDLAVRRSERDGVGRARAKAAADTEADAAAIGQRLQTALTDLANRIHNNENLQEKAPAIRAAVLAVQTLDGQLVEARDQERAQQVSRDALQHDLAEAERALHAFVRPQQDLERAQRDARLLTTVPCGGAGEYASCSFLVNATAAAARIAELEAQVAGVAEALQRVEQLKSRLVAADQALADRRAAISRLTAERAEHHTSAKYEKALVEAETRIAELEHKRAELQAESARQATELQARHAARMQELDAQAATLEALLTRLEGEAATARQDLEAAAAGNSQAVQRQAELAAARREWDATTSTLGMVASGRAELERRRKELVTKQARLRAFEQRRAAIDQELLEWKDLAKALGKGGLPDLEIDAAGPTISALTNDLLLASFGPRFTLELVTQVAKADGSGQKDLFTVEVTDNERGGVRDISDLSGGEKTIVQEALMCAICLFVNQRSPMPIRTLFRDETGAALDPDNARRYVAMLRRVREIGGFVHVFFVSHNAEASALADTQIVVANGTARIVSPPFVQEAA